MSKKINIGLIGCGDIAVTFHIPTLLASPDVKLSVLCDTDLSKAKKLATDNHINSYTSNYKDLLHNQHIQAVIVATPPWVTPNITMECLRAGKHVLCEKPMAMDVKTAMEVAETEKQTGKKVQIGFTYRHDPLLKTLRKWIQEDKLGSPLVYRIGVFDEKWDPVGNFEHYERIFTTMKHASPSVHEGAHIADFLNFLTNSEVKNVDAFGLKSREEFPVPNYDASIIRFQNGDLAKLEIAWFFPSFPQDNFEVIGPKGIAIFDRFKRFLQLKTEASTETISYEGGWQETCFKAQLDQFVASIRSDHPFVPGTIDGINSLQLTKAIETSIKNDRQ